MYRVTHTDPSGQVPTVTTEVPGDRFEINDARAQLKVYDADGNLTAAFINWHSIVPVES